MIIVIFVLLAILLFVPPVKLRTAESRDYLSKEATLPVKGLFVIIVFLEHFKSYVVLSDSFLNNSFLWILTLIGQLCVVMFFFYSGYGIFVSLLHKKDYIKTFIKKRFLPVWLSFALCVLLFVIENLCLGVTYNIKDILLSFTGWTAVGNSNWFMCATFILYILFFLCFRFIKENNRTVGLCVFTFLICVLTVGFYFIKESWWYDTLLCFPLGMWYAKLKDKTDSWILASKIRYFLTLFALVLLFGVGYIAQRFNHIFYPFYAMIFALIIVVITMKVDVKSYLLSVAGKHVFSIYILQRLVFRLGVFLELNNNAYLFFVLSLFITLIISLAYDKLFSLIDRNLLNKKEIKKEGIE